MSTAMITMKKWQDEYLKFMTRVEQPVVKFTGKAAESMAEYVPERPHWAFLDKVHTMTEFVDNQLRFRKRMVDEQVAFVRKMMKAMHPTLVKLESGAPRAKTVAAKPAPVRRVGVRAA